jgi:hypothetical protein
MARFVEIRIFVWKLLGLLGGGGYRQADNMILCRNVYQYYVQLSWSPDRHTEWTHTINRPASRPHILINVSSSPSFGVIYGSVSNFQYLITGDGK